MLEKITTKSMLDCQREAKTHSALHSLNYFMYHVLFHAIRDIYHFNCPVRFSRHAHSESK